MSHLLLSCRVVTAAKILTGLSAPFARADDMQPTVPAIVAKAAPIPAARPASAEVFRPAPMPNESMGSPTQVASDEPNLHPDLLRMHEQANGVLGDTSSEYDRASRVHPAGGMSLSIPVQ